MFGETDSFTVVETKGDVSLAYTIYLKDRRVEIKKTVGVCCETTQGHYDKLPLNVLKAYQSWLIYFGLSEDEQ